MAAGKRFLLAVQRAASKLLPRWRKTLRNARAAA
jgi:hypothetical protein